LWALIHISLGVNEHLGPVIPLIDDLVDEGATFRMIPTIAIVDFLYHFSRTVTSQIRVGVEIGVEFLV